MDLDSLMNVELSLTIILLVPLVVVVTAGVFYLYSVVLRLVSKVTVRNKVVVITDALSALGRECAKIFHQGGARLILCGKSWERLDLLAEELASASDPSLTFPPKVVQLDFGDMECLPEVITEVLDCYGCLDVLILNNSLKVRGPVQNLSLQMDKAVMDNNYFGPVTLAKGLLPSMISRRTGHLLLVNSIQGKLAMPFRTTYAASKHAVQAFFDCLRAEVQEYGILVSTLSTTFISSPTPPSEEDNPTPSVWSVFSRKEVFGVTAEEAAAELVKTLSSRKQEVIMARSLPKAAIYARSFFPNVFFAVMAAGVRNAAAVEELEQ
ncbi:dehydrogenase/reductase SDR family member 7C-B-like [Osmerus eperlanus]|uniref:dehydrogenase/reductase SDR family member 7C-B-like n=1 Tax=Osmerus eperlanus TaxID=29151 RepID=UPI002E0D9D88